jgi:TRAP-type C4-dicarboxylate transport system permease large subunit
VVAANVSIADLFLAGVMPGILLGVLIGAMALFVIRRGGIIAAGSEVSAPIPRFWPALGRALPALLLVGFVLGGILGGRFTATEASAVAVLWAFILGVLVYREIPYKALPGLFANAARTTGVVMLLVGCSVAMSQLLTLEQVP